MKCPGRGLAVCAVREWQVDFRKITSTAGGMAGRFPEIEYLHLPRLNSECDQECLPESPQRGWDQSQESNDLAGTQLSQRPGSIAVDADPYKTTAA